MSGTTSVEAGEGSAPEVAVQTPAAVASGWAREDLESLSARGLRRHLEPLR
ncbi:hypothetical protein ACLESO_30830 [Pyxidicoccus sp. 3LG]